MIYNTYFPVIGLCDGQFLRAEGGGEVDLPSQEHVQVP